MSEIIGHEKIVNELKRFAKSGDLPHGYIFFGPSMVGKKMIAQSLAGFLENGIFEPKSLLGDALLIEPDEKGTLGIDAIRTLKQFLSEKPNASSRRTVIVDGGELLTAEAQGALLKVAEEPPDSALLILITNDIEGLLPTIASRLQKIYFGPLDAGEISAWCIVHGASKKEADEAAKNAFGKPGLALRYIEDKAFQKSLKTAGNLLTLSGDKRRDFVKKLLEDDAFDFTKLLDAMIQVIASDAKGDAKKMARWHAFLELRHEVAYYNLNPKLQLENLLA